MTCRASMRRAEKRRNVIYHDRRKRKHANGKMETGANPAHISVLGFGEAAADSSFASFGSAGLSWFLIWFFVFRFVIPDLSRRGWWSMKYGG